MRKFYFQRCFIKSPRGQWVDTVAAHYLEMQGIQGTNNNDIEEISLE